MVCSCFRVYSHDIHAEAGITIQNFVEKVFIGIGTGLAAGFVIYLLAFPIRYIKTQPWRFRAYLAFFFCLAIGSPLVAHYSGATDAKYIAIITACYLISLNPRDPTDLPVKPLDDFWMSF